MNDKIKELADETGLVTLQHSDEWSNVEKFAELMYGRDENGNCKDGDVIKKHFGVEE